MYDVCHLFIDWDKLIGNPSLTLRIWIFLFNLTSPPLKKYVKPKTILQLYQWLTNIKKPITPVSQNNFPVSYKKMLVPLMSGSHGSQVRTLWSVRFSAF